MESSSSFVGGKLILGDAKVWVMATEFYSDSHFLGEGQGTCILGLFKGLPTWILVIIANFPWPPILLPVFAYILLLMIIIILKVGHFYFTHEESWANLVLYMFIQMINPRYGIYIPTCLTPKPSTVYSLNSPHGLPKPHLPGSCIFSPFLCAFLHSIKGSKTNKNHIINQYFKK